MEHNSLMFSMSAVLPIFNTRGDGANRSCVLLCDSLQAQHLATFGAAVAKEGEQPMPHYSEAHYQQNSSNETPVAFSLVYFLPQGGNVAVVFAAGTFSAMWQASFECAQPPLVATQELPSQDGKRKPRKGSTARPRSPPPPPISAGESPFSHSVHLHDANTLYVVSPNELLRLAAAAEAPLGASTLRYSFSAGNLLPSALATTQDETALCVSYSREDSVLSLVGIRFNGTADGNPCEDVLCTITAPPIRDTNSVRIACNGASAAIVCALTETGSVLAYLFTMATRDVAPISGVEWPEGVRSLRVVALPLDSFLVASSCGCAPSNEYVALVSASKINASSGAAKNQATPARASKKPARGTKSSQSSQQTTVAATPLPPSFVLVAVCPSSSGRITLLAMDRQTVSSVVAEVGEDGTLSDLASAEWKPFTSLNSAAPFAAERAFLSQYPLAPPAENASAGALMCHLFAPRSLHDARYSSFPCVASLAEVLKSGAVDPCIHAWYPPELRAALRKVGGPRATELLSEVTKRLSQPDSNHAVLAYATFGCGLALQIVTLQHELGITVPPDQVAILFDMLRGVRTLGAPASTAAGRVATCADWALQLQAGNRGVASPSCLPSKAARRVDYVSRAGSAVGVG